MAIISAGYDGTVDETQWARLIMYAGSCEYGVAGSGDFKVTAVAGQDRTIQVATGLAWGPGVIDESDAIISKQLTAPVSGSRYDMIVVRRDWQPPGGNTTIEVIEGGQSAVTLPAKNNQAGVLNDQPIALVRVDAGSTVVGEIIDLRVHAGAGCVIAYDPLALQYVNRIGSVIKIGRDVYTQTVAANGVREWSHSYETYMKTSGQTNYTLGKGVSSGAGIRVNFPAGMFQSGVIPNVQLTVVARTPGYAVGRFNVEARNVSHTGFEYWAYRTDLSDGREECRFTIHWLAMQ